MKNRGFTLLELLVVIAIIGILAAVVLASLNSARDRAEAVAVLRQLREIEKAFRVYALAENLQEWPAMSTSNLGDYTIQEIIDDGGGPSGGTFPNFDTYLASSPDTYIDAAKYTYFHVTAFGVYNQAACDAGTPPGAGNHKAGVRIRVGAPSLGQDPSDSATIFEIMDDIVDGSDGEDCGTVSMGGSSESIYYLIARDPHDM